MAVRADGSDSRLQVRLGEKEALDSALAFFEARRQKISGLEFYQERRLKRLGLLTESGDLTNWDSFFSTGDRWAADTRLLQLGPSCVAQLLVAASALTNCPLDA